MTSRPHLRPPPPFVATGNLYFRNLRIEFRLYQFSTRLEHIEIFDDVMITHSPYPDIITRDLHFSYLHTEISLRANFQPDPNILRSPTTPFRTDRQSCYLIILVIVDKNGSSLSELIILDEKELVILDKTSPKKCRRTYNLLTTKPTDLTVKLGQFQWARNIL